MLCRIFLVGFVFAPSIVIGAIARLVLVNTETGLDLYVLENSSIIDISSVGSSLSVRAESDDAFVRFDLDHGASVRVESKSPFMLAGKSSASGKPYKSHRLSHLGDHMLIVTPQSDGSLPMRRMLEENSEYSHAVHFRVVDGEAAPVFQDEDDETGPIGNKEAFKDVTEIPFSPVGTVSSKDGVISIGFSGPVASETSTTDPTPYRLSSPFADYRLTLSIRVFSNTEDFGLDKVPCYYAGAGTISANSHATSGSVWLCHWRPSDSRNITGISYSAQFAQGINVMLPESLGEPAGFMDGVSADIPLPLLPDTRSSTFLKKGEKRVLEFANGTLFEAFGLSSPNLLASADFDGIDFTDSFDFAEHKEDFTGKFPTWAGGKGSGVIGSLEYMKKIGVNAIAVRPTDGLVSAFTGDQGDSDLFFDTSRLAQWQVALDAASQLGIVICFDLGTTANSEMKVLFVREMVARFGHLSVLWHSPDEETTKLLHGFDPYLHPVIPKSFFTHASSRAQILSQPKPAGMFWMATTDNLRNIDWVSISATRNWVRLLMPLFNMFMSSTAREAWELVSH